MLSQMSDHRKVPEIDLSFDDRRRWAKFYFIFIITVFFFIPLLILIVLYVYIASRSVT